MIDAAPTNKRRRTRMDGKERRTILLQKLLRVQTHRAMI